MTWNLCVDVDQELRRKENCNLTEKNTTKRVEWVKNSFTLHDASCFSWKEFPCNANTTDRLKTNTFLILKILRQLVSLSHFLTHSWSKSCSWLAKTTTTTKRPELYSTITTKVFFFRNITTWKKENFLTCTHNTVKTKELLKEEDKKNL